jgi:hypothetical protein
MITPFPLTTESMALRFAPSGSSSLSSASGVLASDESSSSRLAQAPTFLDRLRFILSQPRFHQVLSWLPEGKIWRIHKIDIFIAMVLPLFDEVAQWGSFLRLLKAYRFRELSSSVSSIAFYNEVSPIHEMQFWNMYDTCLTVRLAFSHHTQNFPRDASTPVVLPRLGVDRMTPLPTTANPFAESTVLDTRLHVEYFLDGSTYMLRGTPPAVLEQPQGPLHHMRPESSLLKVNSTRSSLETFVPNRMTALELLCGQNRAGAAKMTQEFLPMSLREIQRKRKPDTFLEGKRTKPRKKWLPPLGPPEGKAAAILGKHGSGP